MRIALSHRSGLEKASLLARALLTYTLALAIAFTDEELAAIEEKNLYARVIYEPPSHPQWRVREDELPPALCVYNLVSLHQAGIEAAVGYYADEYEALVGEGKLRKALEELKAVLSLTRSAYDEYEL